MPASEDQIDQMPARFWLRINGGEDDDCWECDPETRDPNGYGRVGLGGRGVSPMLAHRIAWELTSGPIPGDLCVLHSCDNPPCCNPAHLFLGTRGDNARDRDSKGRHVSGGSPGSLNSRAVLTEAEALEIRRRREAGEKRGVLAREFGVSASTISHVVQRQTWRHI